MDLTINFGTVALRKDLIFGVCVFAHPGEWIPFQGLDRKDKEWVLDELRNSSLSRTIPDSWKSELQV